MILGSSLVDLLFMGCLVVLGWYVYFVLSGWVSVVVG